MKNLEEVFQVVRRYEMRLNPTNCSFGVRAEKFLCYIITQKGIKVNPLKVKMVLDMQLSRNLKELQTLNGRITVLSHFIVRSVERSHHFFRVLKKGSHFKWDSQCQRAFEELKKHLLELHRLTMPMKGDTLYLYLSVGEFALSTVLVKVEVSQQKPIYYVSRIVKDVET